MALPVTPRDYPANAIIENLEGDAVVRATIGADGQISNARIETSSGHALLDSASVALADSSRLSTPPVNAAGEAVSVDVLIDVACDLPLEPADEYLLESAIQLDDGMTLPEAAGNHDVRARDYPPQAIRRRIPGAVALDILVSEDGAPATIEILHSSGQNDIDRAALSVARRFHWVPAMRDGVAVAMQIPVVTSWVVTQIRASEHCHSVPLISDTNSVEIVGELFEGPMPSTPPPATIVASRWVRVNEAGEIDTALLQTKDGWRKLHNEFALALNYASEYEPRTEDGVPIACWYFVPLALPPES
jgi:TonB family protein